MTPNEAAYIKAYIESVITSRLSQLTDVEVSAAQIRTFAERHMALVTGQQMLPQQIFRLFCKEFAPILKWQQELAEQMDEFHGPYELLTDAEMDAIFGITPTEIVIATIEIALQLEPGNTIFADKSSNDNTVDGDVIMYCYKYDDSKYYVKDEVPSIGDDVYFWDSDNESYGRCGTIESMIDGDGHEIHEITE